MGEDWSGENKYKLPFVAAGIRLAGATSDVHILDVRTGKWEKMDPAGEPPSPRAAHAAAAVGSMVVVQVGIKHCLSICMKILAAYGL